MDNGTIKALEVEGGTVYMETITITKAEYRQLIEADTLLRTLCRVIVQEEPYALNKFRAVVGDDLIPYPANYPANESEDE